MNDPRWPTWWDNARHYYSLIEEGSAQPVVVYDWTDLERTSAGAPGTLRLRLEPRFRHSAGVRVLDGEGCEIGAIRREGIVSGLRYAMRRDGELVWTLKTRSIVGRRHLLTRADGESWTFFTPFIGVRLRGEALGSPRLLGAVGEGTYTWGMAIEPGRDAIDLLAAFAFLHRQWAHS